MTDTSREERVLEAVNSLVDSLLVDFDMVDLLTELSERCAQLIGVAAAGFLLADPLGRLHLLAATTSQARALELFELQTDEGPCTDCYTTGTLVSVADLDSVAEERWPRFASEAEANGFAAVHAVPMRAAGLVLGALGLFGSSSGELDRADLLVTETLVHIACVTILQGRPPTPASVLPQLQAALAGRTVVEQAKGLLREVLDVSIEEAFAILRACSHAKGEHLTELARRLMKDRHSRPVLIGDISRFAHTATH